MVKPLTIDLNCDLGEGYGPYQLGNDEAIMPLITSANIACGFHAGDPTKMAESVTLAARLDVAIGAHPGYPDLQGFGRREMKLTPEEVEHLVLYQVGALAAFTRAAGAKLTHVKPHGALYNQAAVDKTYALAIANAIVHFDPGLLLVGLAGSKLVETGQELGLRVVNEAFPDRGYLADGTLMPRNLPGSVLENPHQVAANALNLAMNGISMERSGIPSKIKVDTLCLHGDNPAAIENASLVNEALTKAGFLLQKLC